MPNVRGKGERRLDDALGALAASLRAARVPWMVIGGIAVIARGVRRLTTDVDVVVRGDATSIEALLPVLEHQHIEPRIEKAAAFARENLVLLLRHVPSGIDVDLSFGWTTFELEAIAASTKIVYGSTRLPMARAEDLIVFKVMASRPKDLEDAAALLLMHPQVNRARVRRRLAELADLAGEPELMRGLEGVMQRVRAVRRAPKAEPQPARRRQRHTRRP